MNLLLIDKYFHIEVLYYNGTNCKQWLTLQFKHLWYLVTSCYNPDGTLFQREVLMHNKWPDANPTSNNQKSVDGTYWMFLERDADMLWLGWCTWLPDDMIQMVTELSVHNTQQFLWPWQSVNGDHSNTNSTFMSTHGCYKWPGVGWWIIHFNSRQVGDTIISSNGPEFPHVWNKCHSTSHDIHWCHHAPSGTIHCICGLVLCEKSRDLWPSAWIIHARIIKCIFY